MNVMHSFFFHFFILKNKRKRLVSVFSVCVCVKNRSIKKFSFSPHTVHFKIYLIQLLPMSEIFVIIFSLNKMLICLYRVYKKESYKCFIHFHVNKNTKLEFISKPYIFVVWEFIERLEKRLVWTLTFINHREHILKYSKNLFFFLLGYFIIIIVFQMFLSFWFHWFFPYQILFVIYFHLLIWYNNYIINIKLLIKSDVDSKFKFQSK